MPFQIEKYHFSRESILHGLPEKESMLLKEVMVHRKLKKGVLIFREGNWPKGVYFIEKGKVKIYQTNSEGKEQILFIYSKGESFGYRPLLSGEPNPVSAKTLEDSVLEFIPGNAFIKALNRSSVLPNKLLRALSREYTVWANQVSSFAQRGVRERVALCLLILSEQYKKETRTDVPVEIPISRDDLANYVGSTKETVVRMLRHFKNEKIILTKGRKIIILKPKELEKVTDYS